MLWGHVYLFGLAGKFVRKPRISSSVTSKYLLNTREDGVKAEKKRSIKIEGENLRVRKVE